MQKVTEARQIAQLKKRKKPIILYFHTDWCGPCKLSQKYLQKQIGKSPGKLTIATINCDQCQDLVLDYRVDLIPMMVLLDNDGSPLHVSKGYKIEKLDKLFQKAHEQSKEK